MTRPPTHRVTKQELRDLFNAIILPRVQAGELREKIRSDGTPDPRNNQPPGSRSQIVAYHEVAQGGSARAIALAHRYLRPDGTLGGSGKRLPDPRWVFHEGKIFAPFTDAEMRARRLKRKKGRRQR